MKRLFLLPGFLLLLSCAAGQGNDERFSHGVAPDTLTAHLSLEALSKEESGQRIGIVLRNPAALPVQSIRSWMRFDPALVAISDLRIEDGRFSLFAPKERQVNETTGFLQLGGAARIAIAEERILFASFHVERTSGRTRETSPVILSFYDWKAEGNGHTAVLSLGSHGAVNIIEAPSSLPLP